MFFRFMEKGEVKEVRYIRRQEERNKLDQKGIGKGVQKGEDSEGKNDVRLEGDTEERRVLTFNFIFRINPKSYEDGFVCAPDNTSDIYIRGIRNIHILQISSFWINF